jgi:hypothetical protein
LGITPLEETSQPDSQSEEDVLGEPARRSTPLASPGRAGDQTKPSRFAVQKVAEQQSGRHASGDSIPVGCEAAHLDLSHDSGLGTLASRAAGGREGSQPTAQRVESLQVAAIQIPISKTHKYDLQVTATRLAQAISSRPAPDGERPYSFSSSASGLVSSLLDLLPAPPPSKAEPTAFLSYVLHSLHSHQPDREHKAPGGEKDSQCAAGQNSWLYNSMDGALGFRANVFQVTHEYDFRRPQIRFAGDPLGWRLGREAVQRPGRLDCGPPAGGDRHRQAALTHRVEILL